MLEQIITRVGTNSYYNPNKTLIAKTTYYSNENKFASHLEQ
jgi:hypothetical protein